MTFTLRPHRRGEKHPLAKLTEADVLIIRKRYVPASRVHGAPAIARDYRVNPKTIKDILSGANWGWLS